MNNKPLDGIKVVELSTYVAAPGAARILCDLGAEVIKIESLSGDQWRETGKKSLSTNDDENPIFDVYNAGKKSICVNIKNEEGLAFTLKLIENADIFITNTRARSLKKLGLDAQTLTAKFPRLIYGSIDGFGQKGPDAESPGFDNISFWARSGFSVDALYKSETPHPLPPTTGIGDCVSGGFLVAGIMTALYNRERTGKGDIVPISLYGAAIWAMSSMLLRANPKYNKKFPIEPTEYDPLTNHYECADGEWFNISVRAYDKDAPLMYKLLGIEEEVKSLGEVTVENYMSLGDKLIPMIEAAMKKKTSSEWLKLFNDNGLVCGKLYHFADVLEDEQAWANNFIEEHTNRNGEKTVMPCPPIRFASFEKDPITPAPKIGEDTDSVLKSFGYTDEDIKRMHENGAVK